MWDLERLQKQNVSCCKAGDFYPHNGGSSLCPLILDQPTTDNGCDVIEIVLEVDLEMYLLSEH